MQKAYTSSVQWWIFKKFKNLPVWDTGSKGELTELWWLAGKEENTDDLSSNMFLVVATEMECRLGGEPGGVSLGVPPSDDKKLAGLLSLDPEMRRTRKVW